MASRIRNGKRLPGMATIRRIHREFDVPLDVLVDAYSEGPDAFGRLLRDHLPGTPRTQCPNSTSTSAAA